MDRPTPRGKVCVDGKRKRRHSALSAKRKWYAHYRRRRFAQHLGFGGSQADSQSLEPDR